MKKNCKVMLMVATIATGGISGGLLGGLQPTAVYAQETINKTVNVGGLNVRSQAQKGSSILGVLKAGDVIAVEGVVNGWNKFTYNGKTAYVDGAYLKDGGAVPTVTSTPVTNNNATGNKTVNVSYLNIRSQAVKGSAILGVIKAGDVINVEEVVNGWSKFTYNGKTAYVDGRYLKDVTAVTTTTTQAPTTTTTQAPTTTEATTETTTQVPTTTETTTQFEEFEEFEEETEVVEDTTLLEEVETTTDVVVEETVVESETENNDTEQANLGDFEIVDTVLVTYYGSDTHVVIPDGITAIGEGAFGFNKTLESVLIPEGVVSIGDNAFYECESLLFVTFPESLKSIGRYSFAHASLYDFTLPEGIETIESGAFCWNRNIEHIIIPDNIKFIGDWGFSELATINEISLPAGIELDIFEVFGLLEGSSIISYRD